MDGIRIQRERLTAFCGDVFVRLKLPAADARAAAEVLVAADARGIPSHGVGRLWRYANGLRSGLMIPDAKPETVTETPTSLVVNARGAMGAPVSVRTMERVIAKAAVSGMAFAGVRDSNHFGIAGYYAMQALPHDMIGIAMTNTAALGVPTFGRAAMFGTNPLAFAAPADRERAFVLDMSTTAVTRGKIEVCDREDKALPLGWAVDKTGRPATDAKTILADMQDRRGGGILPLGGAGELFGGHKGYGLAVMVDILCAALSGAPMGPDVFDTATSSARVSHFFGAIRVASFRDPAAFRSDMDRMLGALRETPVGEGESRVYFAGQKEFEEEDRCAREGVPLSVKTYESLRDIGRDIGVPPPEAREGERP
jgi:LDH2 family malate/lactate/ureidoglycolate dehydrogenase